MIEIVLFQYFDYLYYYRRLYFDYLDYVIVSWAGEGEEQTIQSQSDSIHDDM